PQPSTPGTNDRTETPKKVAAPSASQRSWCRASGPARRALTTTEVTDRRVQTTRATSPSTPTIVANVRGGLSAFGSATPAATIAAVEALEIHRHLDESRRPSGRRS